MKSVLDLDLARTLSGSFPGSEWRQVETRAFVADKGDQIYSNWAPVQHLNNQGGVYAVMLPAVWFSIPRTIPLHAPHSHKGEKISFEFTVAPLTPDGYGVVYVGRTSNLAQRLRGHLSRGERKDGGQVKFGLVDCGLHRDDPDSALRALRTHARIYFVVLSGPENCANRDLLEMSLCARFAPPFNIKSER
jgi:hypothetical protein